MKVVIFGSGRSFHATRWANSLVENGISIMFVSVHKIIRPIDPRIKVVTPNFSLSFGKLDYILMIPRIIKSIKAFKPDVLHAHYASGYGLMLKLSNYILRKKSIVSLYGAEVFSFPNKSIFHKFILYWICSSADRVLSTSKVMAERFIELYPNLAIPTVTPFGIDVEKFRQEIVNKRSKRGETSNLVIGLVKKLEVKYGVDILIKAIHRLRAMNVNVSLVVAGDGSQRKELELLIEELEIGNYVELIGWIDNSHVPKFLAELDLVVIPSRFDSESFGVSAVEAMASGRCLIVSNVGGLPEVVSWGECGILFEKDNVDSLVDKIILSINNKELKKQLISNALKKVEAEYNWKNNVNQVVDIYRNVIDDV